jgi:hypothetical protein
MPRGRSGVLSACRRLAPLLAGAALVLFAAGVRAQPAPGDDATQLKMQADVLFKRLLVRPDDLKASFQFAEIETRLGDYEAAIGALERMLFYNQNLPRVRLELGLLYFRLGSYAMARSYFEAAISGPDVPQEVRDRVTPFLAEIDRRLSINQLAFFAQTGLRHQTNANAGPDSQIINVFGVDATIASKFRRRPDWNAFGTVALHHVYDFGNQRGDVWETDFAAYYAHQFQVDFLNLGIAEVTTGPRFGIGEATGLSFHPYVLGNDVTLGDRQYFATLGGGASLRYVTPLGITFEPDAEFRARSFSNSSIYPNARFQEGNQAIAAIGASGALFSESFGWQGRLSYTHDTASYHPYAYDQFGIELALPYQFTATLGTTSHTWTLAPFASFFDVRYAEADPFVDPGTKRHDHLYRAGVTLDTKIYHDFGFAITVEYDQTTSTVVNYRTTDFIVSGGPTVRF